jgi:tripartite ATP-independent transporter DctM subunit
LGDVIGVPVGRLFMGAVTPGLLLIVLFIVYILLHAWWCPQSAPALSIDKLNLTESRPLSFRVMKSLLPPLALIVAVLGSIFFGIASPTESAAIGVIGAMVLATIYRRMSLANLQETMRQTTRLTSMVFLVLIGATAFGLVFRGMGGDMLVEDIMMALPGDEWGFLAVSMLLIFVLGFFLDFLEICFIVVPILAPIADSLGIDLLWFAVLIAVNLQTSFLTPPFGFSLFYLKAAAPKSVSITDIYAGIIPFVLIQLTTLGLLMSVPEISLWLPEWLDQLMGF